MKRRAGSTKKPDLTSIAGHIAQVIECFRVKDFANAWKVFSDKIDEGHGNRRTIIYEHGAWEPALDLISGFYPAKNLESAPQLQDLYEQAQILNCTGFYLLGLGRPRSSESLFLRSLDLIYLDVREIRRDAEKNKLIGIVFRNLAETYYRLGLLTEATKYAEYALVEDLRASNNKRREQSYIYLGWLLSLQGQDDNAASRAFDLFKNQEKEKSQFGDLSVEDSGLKETQSWLETVHDFPDGIRGLYYVRHLLSRMRLKKGEKGICESIKEAAQYNLGRVNHMEDNAGWYCILGSVDAYGFRYENARESYCKAQDFIIEGGSRLVLIEFLLSKGRWMARCGDEMAKKEALEELSEGLCLAIEGDCGIHVADILIAQSEVYFDLGQREMALGLARQAFLRSSHMNYHWGKEEVRLLLDRLGEGKPPGRLFCEAAGIHNACIAISPRRICAFSIKVRVEPELSDYNFKEIMSQKSENIRSVSDKDRYCDVKLPSGGTCWLVAPGVMVTAFHVVGWNKLSRWWNQILEPGFRVKLTCTIDDQEIELKPMVFDIKADIALLEISSWREEFEKYVLQMAERPPHRGERWSTLGFPQAADGVCMTLEGKVDEVHEMSNPPRAGLQLALDGPLIRYWSQMSGAPILNDSNRNRVIGVFIAGVDEENGDPKVPNARSLSTVYAAPVSQAIIDKLLKR